jgi:hypothetical protein
VKALEATMPPIIAVLIASNAIPKGRNTLLLRFGFRGAGAA